MKETISKIDLSSSRRSLWLRFPTWLQAILTGFAVNMVGVGVWVLLVSVVPPPYSVITMGILLVVYVKYFSGSWPPERTREFRKRCFRSITIRKEMRLPTVVAALSTFMFVNAGMILTFRVNKFDPATFKTAVFLDTLPPVQAWLILVMASVVAGVCEEVGFRGYMQKPLEDRYGLPVGILLTSFVFVLVHIHQAWAGGILPQIFLVSLMIGTLAAATKSLLPGIIAHALFDIVNFSYWWSNVAGTFGYRPIGETGVDDHFVITVCVVVGSLGLYVVAVRRLMMG